MKTNRSNLAVSEIVGIALLLGISISLFSIVQTIVFSYPFDPSAPSTNLVGSINQGDILIEHHGGEYIKLESKVIVYIDSVEIDSFTLADYLDTTSSDSDDFFEIGEIVIYTPIDEDGNPIDLTGFLVKVTVIDIVTNSVILDGLIQEDNS